MSALGTLNGSADGADVLSLRLAWTVFPDVKGRVAERQETTWAELCNLIADPPERGRKEQLALLKLATFGGRRSNRKSLRHDANVETVHGIEGDHDAGTLSLDEAEVQLQQYGIAALIYSTPSHRAERPRWRVLAPLSRPHMPQERARLVGLLNAVLNGVLASESFVLSQTYFFGRVSGTGYEVRCVAGREIDTLGLDLVFDPLYPGTTFPNAQLAVSSEAIADESYLRALLRAIPNKAFEYEGWIKVGAALYHATNGATWALGLWDERSSTAPGYDGREALDCRWDGFARDSGPRAGVQTLEALADWTEAELQAFQKSRVVESFDDLSEAASDAPPERFAVVAFAEFITRPAPLWIVADVLPQAALAMLFGESGIGKSFHALDLGLAVARGVRWHGKPVRQGRVVYIASEGAGGVSKRLRAYARHHDVDPREVPFGVIADAPNLLQDADVRMLAQRIGAAGGAALVIVDTLAASTPGADEASSKDMGRVIGRCLHLHRATGALILVVHHSGKDAAKGARGWSGLRGAVHTEIELTKMGDARVASVTKQKDGEDGARYGFRLVSVHVGDDVEGNPISSCVAEPISMSARATAQVKVTGPLQKSILRALQDASNLGDSADAVPVDTVIAAVAPSLPFKEGERDQRPGRIRQAIERMVGSGLLTVQNNAIWLATPAT